MTLAVCLRNSRVSISGRVEQDSPHRFSLEAALRALVDASHTAALVAFYGARVCPAIEVESL